jgi:Domain of unknown function (DUF4878)
MPHPKTGPALRRGPFSLRLLAIGCAALTVLTFSACAKTVSTAGLKGEAKNAAETVKDLQTDVTAGDQKKVCQNDLAKSLAAKLEETSGGCQQAVKDQLAEIDSFEVTVEAMQVSGSSATAHVKSIFSGKSRKSTLSLVKEGSRWKISALS